MLTKINNLLLNLATKSREEEGQGLTEYALLLGAIAAVSLAGLVVLMNAIDAEFTSLGGIFGGS